MKFLFMVQKLIHIKINEKYNQMAKTNYVLFSITGILIFKQTEKKRNASNDSIVTMWGHIYCRLLKKKVAWNWSPRRGNGLK